MIWCGLCVTLLQQSDVALETDIGEFFSERVVMHWHRMELPPLEVIKNRGGVAPRDVGTVGSAWVGLGILGVFNLSDSVILHVKEQVRLTLVLCSVPKE